MAAPLYQLTEKGHSFTWTEDCQVVFEQLKEHLNTAPVLCMPADDKPYVLDTDASDFAIGAVLSQEHEGVERVVAYASRRLSHAEVNYCVTRRELLAIVHFVKYFRHYLLGRTFVVRTDHAALRWLKRIPQPIGQQARWLEILEEFSFTIVHRAGAKHGNADAMSRRPCDRRRCCPLSTGMEQDNDNGRDGEVYAVETQQVGDDAPTDELPTDELPSWTDCEIKGEQETDLDLGPVYAALVLGGTCPEWDEIAGMSGTSKALFQ